MHFQRHHYIDLFQGGCHISHLSIGLQETLSLFILLIAIFDITTVVPATAGPLGERPPASAGHFCDVPTNLPC